MSRDLRDQDVDGGDSGRDEEPAATGRSASGSLDGGRSARAPKLREDPRGRRSLTGLEFRRQRSG